MTMDSISPSQNWLQRVCNDQHNIDSQIYNTKLQSLIHNLLQTTLHDAKIAYFDIYTSLLDMAQYPTKYGNLLLTHNFSFFIFIIRKKIMNKN